ncbi:hypothetical protein [Alicyclobacillus macrosporangiidus]|uniref:4-hydroxybenzoate polyprenyltransferase n=1 Tax=Alicyclobacillus macrosporangiidus TaxID=392015 RepID=A0A1I7IUR4_9BACL|nr:hypothetical protein [Alicyclobacillus macrosporangiidus]SFU76639.1 hypothetical protein SAMN05421543_107136 [Alicyclobacillus macrosporangiidus]
MSGGLLEWGIPFLTMLLAGAAIKLMDDHLDAEYDVCRGEQTLAIRFGRAVLPYTMVAGLLAAAADHRLACALFFASYAVGMFSRLGERLPTGLPAWAETLLAVALAALVSGWQWALWALALMAAIDWTDDLADAAKDALTGQRNLALRVGVVETTLLALLALCVAVVLNAKGTAMAFVAFALLTLASEATTVRLWDPEEGREDPGWPGRG